nr:hypothetical protein [Prolixibacteraceae bacterium]
MNSNKRFIKVKFSFFLLVFSLLSCFFSNSLNAQTVVSTGKDTTWSKSNPHQIISFDNDWLFWLGDDPAAKEPNFDDTRWRSLSVPHDWSIEQPANPP